MDVVEESQVTGPAAANADTAHAGPQHEAGGGWKGFLDLAGAAAGVIILLGLVGRLVIAARLHAVGLPTATGVSLVTADVLLSVGAGTLALSLVLGLAAVLSLYAIRFALANAGDRALLTGYIVLAVTLEAILVVVTSTARTTWGERLVAWAAGLVAAVILVLFARAKGVATRRVALAFFFAIAGLGGFVGIVRSYEPPADLDMATLFFNDGAVTTGAFVGSDSSNYYIAPDLFEKVYGQIAAIPRMDVARVALARPPVPYVSVGKGYPSALIGSNLPVTDQLSPQVDQWLAAQVESFDWLYPPLTYDASATYLAGHTEVYFGSKNHRAPIDQPVSLSSLVAAPEHFAGQALITHGRVIGVTPAQSGGASATGEFVTMRAADDSEAQAFCYSPTRHEGPPGYSLTIHGLLIASGIMRSPPVGHVRGVFLLCSSTSMDGGPRSAPVDRHGKTR